ncbi:MAG: hypothetical protein mread185_000518 [Mycoplasmataceae bacterium]|nr:MAG: hypothetical protein mread185_000518 [Mycoplasmataceae bacterium]
MEITGKIKSLVRNKGREFQESEIYEEEEIISNSSSYAGYSSKNLTEEEKSRDFKQPPKRNNNSSMFKDNYKEKEDWGWGWSSKKNSNSVSERKRILQEKIKKLEAELAILKSEYQSLEGQSDEKKYQAVINAKESELQNYQYSLTRINESENYPSNNKFSIGSLIWIIVPIFFLIGLLIIVKKHKFRDRRKKNYLV